MIYMTLLLLLSSCFFTQINAMDNHEALAEWMAPFATMESNPFSEQDNIPFDTENNNKLTQSERYKLFWDGTETKQDSVESNTSNSTGSHDSSDEQTELSFADEYYQAKEYGERLHHLKHHRSSHLQKPKKEYSNLKKRFQKGQYFQTLKEQHPALKELIEQKEEAKNTRIEDMQNTLQKNIAGHKTAIAFIEHADPSVRVRKNNKEYTKSEYLRDACDELRFVVGYKEEEETSTTSYETESQSDNFYDESSSSFSPSESAYYGDESTTGSQTSNESDPEFHNKLETVIVKKALDALTLDTNEQSFADEYNAQKKGRAEKYAKKIGYHERDRKKLLVAKYLSNAEYGITHTREKDQSQRITNQETQSLSKTEFKDNTPQQALRNVPVYKKSTQPMTYTPAKKPIMLVAPTDEGIPFSNYFTKTWENKNLVIPMAKAVVAIVCDGKNRDDAMAKASQCTLFLERQGYKETCRLFLPFECTKQ